MALQQPGFDLSPQASSIPLGVEDVDWLLQNGKPIFKDARKRSQLLQRMKNTLQMYRSAMNDLHREINRLQAELSAPGMSSGALDPLNAARYLSAEQKEQLFTGSMREAWTALLRLRADATQLRAQANSDLGAARFALAKVLEDTTISETVRQQVSRRLAELPPPVAVELSPIGAPLPDLAPAVGWAVGQDPTQARDASYGRPDPARDRAATAEPGDDTGAGDATGGDMAGGDMAGGDMAGGDMAGGDMAGGDMAGGDMSDLDRLFR